MSEEEKNKIEDAIDIILRGNDIESSALILEKAIMNNHIIVKGRVNILKIATRQILNFIEEYKNKGSLDIIKEKVKANDKITKLQKENEKLNKLLKFSLDYIHKLEEDLYEGTSNFIVRKDKIREKLKKLIKKLNEPNNDRWEKDDNIYYDKIKCQIRILKELLEGDKNG